MFLRRKLTVIATVALLSTSLLAGCSSSGENSNGGSNGGGTATAAEVLANKNADLRNRANMANAWGADYFVSIHTNSSVNPAANGAEVYVYRLGTPAAELAQSVLDAIVRDLGSKDNGVRQANFAVLSRTSMPAILVELGYLSNPTEALNLNSPAWQKAVAKAIFDGIYAYVKP